MHNAELDGSQRKPEQIPAADAKLSIQESSLRFGLQGLFRRCKIDSTCIRDLSVPHRPISRSTLRIGDETLANTAGISLLRTSRREVLVTKYQSARHIMINSEPAVVIVLKESIVTN